VNGGQIISEFSKKLNYFDPGLAAFRKGNYIVAINGSVCLFKQIPNYFLISLLL
jgi:hypothetical protein